MKKVVLNAADPASIIAAVAEIKKHLADRQSKIKTYVHRLAEIGAEAARNAYYGGSINPNHMPTNEEGLRVSVQDLPNGSAIIAQGSQVMFLEFGAGVETKDHELSGTLNIEIMPGSWSEGPEGKHTWSQWLDSSGRFLGVGRRFSDYPYNRTPRAGMWEAYKAIQAAQQKVAEEVFGK